MKLLVARILLTSLTFSAFGCSDGELPPTTEEVKRPPEDAMQNAMKESMEKGGRQGTDIPASAPGK